MPSTPMQGVSARDIGYGVVQSLRKKITFGDNGSTITVGKMPPYSIVIGGGVHIVTAFNDSGTDLLDVGFIGATTDADAYATDLTLAAVGYIVLDELGATSNIMQTIETTVTCAYAGENSNATTGEAWVIVNYVSGYPAGI